MFWFYKIKNWLGKYWQWPVVFLIAALFFILVSWFIAAYQADNFIKWSSPDETANYFTARQFAKKKILYSIEKYNPQVDGIISPRSLRGDDVMLKPMSFLGISIYYGQLGRWFGYNIIPYLTPALAALGLIFFYLLVKKLFGEREALVALILAATFPVYIYYSARSMFHNVPFVALLIIGLYFAVLMGEKNEADGRRQKYLRWLYAALAGYFCGLSLTMRTSELIWLLPALGLAWLFNAWRLKLMRPLIFVYFFVVAFVPIFVYNFVLYGSIWSSGYPQLNNSVAIITESSGNFLKSIAITDFKSAYAMAKAIYHNFFYFGFDQEQSLTMLDRYGRQMFPWLWYLGLGGLLFFCLQFRGRKKSDLVYFLFLLVSAVILIFYYGSWQFSDNPDPNRFTIGNSYTRYWLPIYFGFLPFVALLIVKAVALLDWRRLSRLAEVTAALIIAASSIVFVLYGSEEGLIPTYLRQAENRQQFATVMSLTGPEAIIITRYHDKLFFPERRVIVASLNEDEMLKRYAMLASKQPLYYYNFTFSVADLDFMNKNKLADFGLVLMPVKVVTQDFSLYRLKSK